MVEKRILVYIEKKNLSRKTVGNFRNIPELCRIITYAFLKSKSRAVEPFPFLVNKLKHIWSGSSKAVEYFFSWVENFETYSNMAVKIAR